MFKTSKFLQKMTTKIPFDENVLSFAVDKNGVIFACTESGLFRYCDNIWNKLSGDLAFSKVVVSNTNRVLALSENSLYEINDNGAEILFTFPEKVCSFCLRDTIWVATEKYIYIETGDAFVQKETHPIEQSPDFFAAFEDRVCTANSRCIQRLEGKRRTWRCVFHDHCSMPEIDINCVAFDKIGNLLVGSKQGLYIYDYRSTWLSKKEIKMLPSEEIYSITVLDDGAIFAGTAAGAVLLKNGVCKYLPAKKYAFETNVIDVASSSNDLYTYSKGGFVKITFEEMDLYKKAVHIYEETEKYFPRKDGYVTSIFGELGKDVSHISDNDGLWTQMYLAALCMWYGVTKDKKILERARVYKNAMLILTKAPEKKGFVARAVRYPDEKGWGENLESDSLGQEWHRSSDGTYEWLGETSSDELTGHYVGFALYYDLCADDKEKDEIRQAVCDITDHILENDGYLCDIDGLPTSWACWNEHALNDDNMWMWEKGVNSLEMLNFLKISYHISGDEKYEKKYKNLISEHHFLLNATHHKRADGHCSHIDDNLAMLNTLTYLMYEKNESIRQYILMGLADHYEYEKIEGNPYFGFIYSAFTGEPCDVDTCIKALKDFPYETEALQYDNDNRKDLEYDDEPVYWGEPPRLKKPLNWDERYIGRVGLHAFTRSSKDDIEIFSGMSYLFIYWLGRFLNMFE